LQECLAVAAALLEVLGRAHRADAGDAAAQRDHPEPAVLVPDDADVAGILAGPALDTGVVAEQCRRCMPGVAALQAEPGPEERVAAAGVDEIARLEPQRAIVAARMYQRRASIQLDPIDPDAVACVHALRARVVE